MRIEAYPDLASCQSWITGVNDQCISVSSGATITAAELSNAQGAKARGAKVWVSFWSPPAGMKSNGSFVAGGNMQAGAANANYIALAPLQASVVTLFTGTYGIPVAGLSFQNEPDVSNGTYPSCLWTAQQIHDYIPYLSAALTVAGYSTPLIIAEPTTFISTLMVTAMADAAVASDITILAGHAYAVNGYTPISNGLANTGACAGGATACRQWETEVSNANAYDGSITSALTYATMIANFFINSGINLWSYWLCVEPSTQNDNGALTDNSGNLAKRAYAIGQWSKFVLPGWWQLSKTYVGAGGLLINAFSDQAKTNFAVQVVNGSGVAVALTTTLSAGPAFTTVTPYITSSTQSLAAQPTVPVVAHVFGPFSIPANSVVTFANTPPANSNFFLVMQ